MTWTKYHRPMACAVLAVGLLFGGCSMPAAVPTDPVTSSEPTGVNGPGVAPSVDPSAIYDELSQGISSIGNVVGGYAVDETVTVPIDYPKGTTTIGVQIWCAYDGPMWGAWLDDVKDQTRIVCTSGPAGGMGIPITNPNAGHATLTITTNSHDCLYVVVYTSQLDLRHPGPGSH